MTAALLGSAGLRVGAYISPHVPSLGRADPDRRQPTPTSRRLSPVSGRTRAGATQFEVLTAAALAEFAAGGVDVAVVEAGLGGRHDATNVLAAGVVVLTNVALEHTAVLGDTRRGDRGREARRGHAGRHRRARRARVGGEPRAPPARAIVEVDGARISRSPSLQPRRFLGRRGRSRRGRERSACRAVSSAAPSIRSRSGTAPTTSPASATCCRGCPSAAVHDRRLDPRRQAGRGDAPRPDPARRHAGRDAVAEPPRDPRRRARARSRRRISRASRRSPIPAAAFARARTLAGPDGAVLVTGSLYLLAALSLDG